MRRPVVTFLTDYGPGSEYVGALHAVVAAARPEADRLDLAHDVPPGDIRMGALLLARLAPMVPEAIHVAVVDPGVGTERRGVAVALESGGALVGPDNGLIGPAARLLGPRAAAILEAPPDAPATFHGRDVFAPAAARLAGGEEVGALGPAVDPALLASPEPPPARTRPGCLEALAVGVDRFGNVQLLAGPAELAAAGFSRGDRIWAATGERRHPATVARAFGDVARRALMVYLDSHDMVALAVNGGSAAARVGVAPGDTVTLARWELA